MLSTDLARPTYLVYGHQVCPVRRMGVSHCAPPSMAGCATLAMSLEPGPWSD